MKCIGLMIVVGLASLWVGIASAEEERPRAHVTGIGGVFILDKGSSKELTAWYQEHLGIKLEPFGGAILNWQKDQAEDGGITIWGAANSDSTWFSPSKASFMINYRVDDLERLISQLEEAGIPLEAGPEYHENGAFAWLLDPDGNKNELWEPLIWGEKNKR